MLFFIPDRHPHVLHIFIPFLNLIHVDLFAAQVILPSRPEMVNNPLSEARLTGAFALILPNI